MSNNNETVADIVSMLRANARGERFDDFSFTSLADRIEAAWKRERDEMLDALVRIGRWCAQDLVENAYISDSSGNYLKTLNGLCDICRPFMQEASMLKRYGGVE